MPIRLDTGERRRPAITSGPPDAIPASVLVLITPDRETAVGSTADDADAELILIERAHHGHHPGEISFPGGRAERDETAEATALREAAEEVGLDAAAAGVRVIGCLETFWIPVSGYRVQPVLAVADRWPALQPSPDEVEAIIRAPLAAFVPPAAIQVVETTVRGWSLRYGAYPVGEYLVWGATARILGQLGALMG
ncbi:MAG: CoA pyrophosphatase [Chloroflexi bacterium]|nr:CoA pyrophosphatase [Chloroflexota bacterium]